MKNGRLLVRQYRESDRDAVWELHCLALSNTGAILPSGVWDDDLHNIRRQYIENRGEFLVGVWDNKIVCMGVLREKSSDIAEIKRMRVHPDFQRKGFGQTILKKLEEQAKKLGYTGLCLDTTTLHKYLRKSYKRKTDILKHSVAIDMVSN